MSNKRSIKRDAQHHVAMLIDSALAAGAEWGMDPVDDEEYLIALEDALYEIKEYHHRLGWIRGE